MPMLGTLADGSIRYDCRLHMLKLTLKRSCSIRSGYGRVFSRVCCAAISRLRDRISLQRLRHVFPGECKVCSEASCNISNEVGCGLQRVSRQHIRGHLEQDGHYACNLRRRSDVCAPSVDAVRASPAMVVRVPRPHRDHVRQRCARGFGFPFQESRWYVSVFMIIHVITN